MSFPQVKLLVEAGGADPNLICLHMGSAAEVAAACGMWEVVHYLIGRGARGPRGSHLGRQYTVSAVKLGSGGGGPVSLRLRDERGRSFAAPAEDFVARGPRWQ